MIPYSGHPVIERLRRSFERLYGANSEICTHRTVAMVGRYGIGFDLTQPHAGWDQKTAILISYGDMIRSAGEHPLAVFTRFAEEKLRAGFNTIHLLPFFPYSSDDGFSVIHFRTVNPDFGSWEDIQNMGRRFRLMFDLVLNHVSRRSGWFMDYEKGIAPARHYFIETDPASDLSAVARPRSTPLLTPVNTVNGVRHLWSTFSADQLDLNYSNLNVVFEMMDILLFYVSMGARLVRLDAAAYLWKKTGANCINLPETHEIVKIFRALLDLLAPDVLLLTETNIPHDENISYFGNGDEAHMVYQFSLPPLALHALLTGNARHLTRWAASLADPPRGCTFVNFTASHDGIGVRPLEGLLPPDEIVELLRQVRERGGQISTRRAPDGRDVPYEMNITYFDALSFADKRRQNLHPARFLCSQTIALSLKGIPAVYFNSLMAARNDYVLERQTGQARSLNRTKWQEGELNAILADPSSEASRVFKEYIRLLTIRARHPAFHPDGGQSALDLGDSVFAVLRTAPKGDERVLAIHNVTERPVSISSARLEAHDFQPSAIADLISGREAGGDFTLAPYQSAWLCAR